jgi:MFS family permease
MPIYCAVGCFALGFLLVSTMREQPPAESPQPANSAAPAADESVVASVNMQVLIPFLGLTFVWFFGMSSVVTLWPVFMKSEGYTQTQISGLWGMAAAGEVVWLFVVGLLADRVGRKWLLITGVAGQACIYIAYTIAQGFAWFLPIQAIRSFTYSSYETPALLYATELGLRQRRGRLAGLYHTASGIGGVIGAAFGGSVAKAIGMRPMFLIVAGVMILLAVIAAVIMPNRVAPAPALQSQPASV